MFSYFLCFIFLSFNIFVTDADQVETENNKNETLYRLRGGDEDHEGRVEVFFGGEWGTVCDDNWNLVNARVICRSLGWDGALAYKHSAHFGSGEGKIWMDDVECLGPEGSLASCDFGGWGLSDCSHHEDVSVVCSPVRLWPLKIEEGIMDTIRLRLPKGHKREVPISHGYVEIKEGKKWRKVCVNEDQDMSQVAYVTCGQLGFPDGHAIDDVTTYLAKESRKKLAYVMGDVNCTGTETAIGNCDYTVLDSHDHEACHGSPLVVRCQTGFTFNTHMRKYKVNDDPDRPFGTVPNIFKSTVNTRVRAGSNVGEGRIEILRFGRWGTVCHKGWDLKDASVACREMGFGTAKRAIKNSGFGEGHGPIWVTNMTCHGNESKLSDCDQDSLSYSRDYHVTMNEAGGASGSDPECSHSEESGVICNVPELRLDEKIKLAGGRLQEEGVVEIRVKKKWGLVCSDDWGVMEALVACKQLGYGFAAYALKDVIYFPSNLTEVVMTGVKCRGDETSLQECQRDVIPQTCGEGRARPPLAGVMCAYNAPDLVTDIPLMQHSLHLDDRALSYLYCSHEEGCLSPSADEADWPYGSRRLVRFSSRVWNRGKADFKPAKTKNQWIWHQCHRHYHSMDEFTHYDILNLNFSRVAEGHKASFCLEDSECSPGVEARFDCDSPSGGEQGIAVGCADNYRYNIDCQWIDITDVKPGNYLLRVHVNPHKLVAESDFSNNQVYCNLQYDGSRIWAWNCHFPEDYDADTISRYYTEEIYP